jgi:uncharacterized damage-inducible protein DinB
MKVSWSIAIALLLVLGPVAAVFAGQAGGSARPAITTLAGDVIEDWAALEETIVNAADALPEDKFGFKSTPAQRSFGEHVLHIVEVNSMLYATLGAKAPAPAINKDARTKAEIMTALRQSFDYGEAIIKEFNDQQWVARVTPPPFMGTSASRLRLIYFVMQHTQDTYGQMVVYLRLNGVVPPASRRGGI